MRWLASVDPPAVLRGASSGFTVLVIGGLAAPVVVGVVPAAGMVWLPLVAVVAFVVAAARGGSHRVPAVQGATAALTAYLLVLPLVVLVTRSVDLVQIATTASTAVLVGAGAGYVHVAWFTRAPR
ncbi:hypothetical protein SAMN06265360_12136 [Haloechinothrix alba]|uniref:Integral membrane protein n=1 Tax=Haloechinothrix alba TaxID=664784 RepID=A0A238ZGL6_9PSEU|nr:hypothetical protein [Haloechinothrix alba]SNR82151.1 hypothetical protein SAMN06265360_12136 [Haloechinothrix alba]